MRKVLLAISGILIAVSIWLAMGVAAIEPVRRNIIYFHVPVSICSMLCFVPLLICSICYLVTKRRDYDLIACASAEVGLVFATLMNLSGMIFAYVEWNIWWTPSPRLVSSAVLWFLYIAYLLLRASFTDEPRRSRISAVFGIIAFVDVPIVYVSARFIRDIHRANFSFDNGWQYAALGLATLGTLILASSMIWLRTETLKNKK